MKIENTVPQPVATADRPRKNQLLPKEEAQQPENQGNAAFNVHLSNLMERNAPQGDEDEIRRAKVAAIRDQLAAGSYNISGKDVAGKILEALKN
ncbi:flagellar biosynthesis anti-sigma factor FlgM [Pelotalea chapellei]|uniref:Negative regulator of flagellin synthesis n=1 Tax=Pelotalea chapellei TaxID=44671 RepID=A0ABS5U869_9BACT|nr:flagellar biosynthesis anti-sigma factor FlgM [Pelotalea chapellei]MBT1071868.1 flagellar biosynthesis anti-sigma factor FlgM [Pelotalea chapellei]